MGGGLLPDLRAMPGQGKREAVPTTYLPREGQWALQQTC